MNVNEVLLRDLRRAIAGYRPSDIGFVDHEHSQRVWEMAAFVSKWPEAINSAILECALRRISNVFDLCEFYFRHRAREESVGCRDVTFFIRTYSGDYCWLELLFSSLEKFAPEIPVVVCVEEQDSSTIRSYVPDRAKVVVEEKFCDGTIQQKYSKLTADYHCETDYVIYLDSDSILTKPFDICDWMVDGKPCLEYTTMDDINRWFKSQGIVSGNPSIWLSGVSFALGCAVDREFSRRLEKIYKTKWLSLMRDRIESVHGVGFSEFMASQKGVKRPDDLPDQKYFSDFNYMGAYLWGFLRDELFWMNTSNFGFWCRPLCAGQFHSYTMTTKVKGVKEINDIPKKFFHDVVSIWDSEEPIEASNLVRALYKDLRSKYRY